LPLALCAALACDSPNRGLPLGPSIGGSGSATSGSSIAGTWRRTFIVQTTDDVITSETTWLFSQGPGCERTVVSSSVLLGTAQVQRSPCTYQVGSGRVTVQFQVGGPVSFSANVSGGRLLLDGVEFARVA
jgi:hypothetical protein